MSTSYPPSPLDQFHANHTQITRDNLDFAPGSTVKNVATGQWGTVQYWAGSFIKIEWRDGTTTYAEGASLSGHII